MTDAPQIRVSTYGELIEGLKRCKEMLGLSDWTVDDRAGFCAGHFSKIVTGERGLGATTLLPLLDVLALDLVLVPSAEKLARLGEIEKRRSTHVRTNHPRIGKGQVERARPHVLRALGITYFCVNVTQYCVVWGGCVVCVRILY